MDFILNRYRNLSVLLVVILAQLLLLAYQVRSNGEARLIRVWAVSAVTPLARVIEGGRSKAAHFFHDYFVLLGVEEENQRLKAEIDRLNMENQYYRTELSSADRARSLAIFQQHSSGKMLAARIISNTTSSDKVVIVDRGSTSGIQKGMAVRTPEGIVGKIISVYPTVSYLRLITDASFAAGVVSAKGGVHGTLRGQGHSTVMVDHIENEQTLEQGEWFYTSGDDLIFPKGLPVGQAVLVKPGAGHKDVYVTPSGLRNGLEEVLIITEGVHMQIPDHPPDNQPVHLQAPPPQEPLAGLDAVPQDAPVQSGPNSTDADRLRDRYRKIGEAQKHTYGAPGSVPNYNIPLPSAAAPAPARP